MCTTVSTWFFTQINSDNAIFTSLWLPVLIRTENRSEVINLFGTAYLQILCTSATVRLFSITISSLERRIYLIVLEIIQFLKILPPSLACSILLKSSMCQLTVQNKSENLTKKLLLIAIPNGCRFNMVTTRRIPLGLKC